MTDIVPVSPPVTVGEDILRYLGFNPQNLESQALALICERYQLDPLLGHVTIIGTRNGMRPYITRDGMLEIAHRSGQLDGIVVEEQRRNTTDNGWTAYVSVWRKDCTHPYTYGAQCKDTEAQAKQGNGPEMALARAERRALKRAFRIPAPDLGNDVEPELLRVEAIEHDSDASARWEGTEALDTDEESPTPPVPESAPHVAGSVADRDGTETQPPPAVPVMPATDTAIAVMQKRVAALQAGGVKVAEARKERGLPLLKPGMSQVELEAWGTLLVELQERA